MNLETIGELVDKLPCPTCLLPTDALGGRAFHLPSNSDS
jgi:hypothetical protein